MRRFLKNMPIYEYECKKCGKAFEVYQRISASINNFSFQKNITGSTTNEDIKCPVCGAEKPTRKISAFNSSGSSYNGSSYGSSSCSGEGRSGFG
jgi:putative FmdB family regulatory protein